MMARVVAGNSEFDVLTPEAIGSIVSDFNPDQSYCTPNTGNVTVSQVVDVQGHPFAQSIAGKRPAQNQTNATFNGQPTITIAGNQKLELPSASLDTTFTYDGSGMSLVLVFDQTNDLSYGELIANYPTGYEYGGFVVTTQIDSANPNPYVNVAVVNGQYFARYCEVNTACYLATKTPVVLCVRFLTGALQARINNAAWTYALSYSGAPSSSPCVSPMVYGQSNNYTGRIARVALFNSVLSDDDMDGVCATLATQYGIVFEPKY